MSETTEKEYIDAAKQTATNQWGSAAEEAESHIETTAGATYRISNTGLKPHDEPFTFIIHRRKP